MTVPTITELDLEALATLTPDLNFEDDERRAVLLENQSRDICIFWPIVNTHSGGT